MSWNWWGTWLLDYLAADHPWEAYRIWRTAYLSEFPALQAQYDAGKIGDFYLITHHYSEAIVEVEKFLRPLRKLERFWFSVAHLLGKRDEQ